MKAKLGPDHPDTLISMNNLASATRRREAGQGPATFRGDAGLRKPSSAPTTPTPSRAWPTWRRATGRREAGQGPAALRGDAGPAEVQARPRPPRHPRQHGQPGGGLPGRRQAGQGPAALRGDAGPPEVEARPRPPQHPPKHEQPGGGVLVDEAARQVRPAVRRGAHAQEKAKLGRDHPDTLDDRGQTWE